MPLTFIDTYKYGNLSGESMFAMPLKSLTKATCFLIASCQVYIGMVSCVMFIETAETKGKETGATSMRDEMNTNPTLFFTLNPHNFLLLLLCTANERTNELCWRWRYREKGAVVHLKFLRNYQHTSFSWLHNDCSNTEMLSKIGYENIIKLSNLYGFHLLQ